MADFSFLSPSERALFRKLSTPQKIQDFLDELPQNHEEDGDTCRSPREVIAHKKAHCIEGAMLAAAILWYHGKQPLLLDLKTHPKDFDHVVALYQTNGYWGAISKTNHAVLRFRDPVYRTVRELALSYFHEYFLLTDGRKTLRGYSRPFSLIKFGTTWVTEPDDLWEIGAALDDIPHFEIAPKENLRNLRRASEIERKAASIPEWEPEK